MASLLPFLDGLASRKLGYQTAESPCNSSIPCKIHRRNETSVRESARRKAQAEIPSIQPSFLSDKPCLEGETNQAGDIKDVKPFH